MDHISLIKKALDKKVSLNDITRMIYLTTPTKALIGKEDKEFEILNEISLFFKIPINHIQVCGSSKTGMSFHKKSIFKPTISDLDIAIIDPVLFLNYSELVFKLTNGLSDNSKFKDSKGAESYKKYITKGIFRPDLMPSCIERTEWSSFFNKLSIRHDDHFKSISAGIYQSQLYFEYKQLQNINIFTNSSTTW